MVDSLQFERALWRIQSQKPNNPNWILEFCQPWAEIVHCWPKRNAFKLRLHYASKRQSYDRYPPTGKWKRTTIS